MTNLTQNKLIYGAGLAALYGFMAYCLSTPVQALDPRYPIVANLRSNDGSMLSKTCSVVEQSIGNMTVTLVVTSCNPMDEIFKNGFEGGGVKK